MRCYKPIMGIDISFLKEENSGLRECKRICWCLTFKAGFTS